MVILGDLAYPVSLVNEAMNRQPGEKEGTAYLLPRLLQNGNGVCIWSLEREMALFVEQVGSSRKKKTPKDNAG